MSESDLVSLLDIYALDIAEVSNIGYMGRQFL